jgi:hypothetical protein
MSPRPITAFALTLFAAGCAGGHAFDQADDPGLPDSIFVEAVNENFYDARIHAVYDGGQRRTLGTIAGNGGHAEVALGWEPHALVFEISFIVSGEAYVSYPLDVARGDRVEVRVPPNIASSGFFRRVSRD